MPSTPPPDPSRPPARALLALPAAAALGMLAMTALTRQVAASRTHGPDDVPEASVAIVLGAQVFPGGVPSGFLTARLEIAAALWRAGKVPVILVSGDDSAEHHHEATSMKAWLVARGIPEGAVVCDPEGHDTFATVARAIGVYGLSDAIVVSQSYHLPRALSAARALGLEAYGVGDDTASRWTRRWRQGQVREIFANVKLFSELVTRERPSTADNSVLAAVREQRR